MRRSVRLFSAVLAVAALTPLAACAEESSAHPPVTVTYRLIVEGSDLLQAKAVSYLTAEGPGKDSVRADMGTTPLTRVAGGAADKGTWEVTTTVTDGQPMEVMGTPAPKNTASCTIMVGGNVIKTATAAAGQTVLCTTDTRRR